MWGYSFLLLGNVILVILVGVMNWRFLVEGDGVFLGGGFNTLDQNFSLIMVNWQTRVIH